VFVDDGRVIYSASDLAAAARCEYALLRSFDAQLGWGPPIAVEDELLARTATLGGEHEHRQLDELRSRAESVAVIGRPTYTVAGLTAAAEQTMRAVMRRAPVIYQAAMFDGRFVGFADFLVFDGLRYRLRDTKLARSVKVESLLQLAAYAEVLAVAGVPIAPEVELLLGDGAAAGYRVDELIPVYRPRRDDLERLLDAHFAGGAPVRWDDPDVRACFRCPECTIQVRAHDDLLLVANMRVSQRARLIDAGIATMTRLAHHSGAVADLPARTVAALQGQARLQIQPRVGGRPPYEIADPQPLTLLPDPDRGDLFFDFEGDPLWTDDGAQWGLEYLFGVLDTGGAFRPLWAHDRQSERRAFLDFLDMVRKRRGRYPRMHIYHYAAYEKTALLRLAGRFGFGEDEVDELLRSGVLVDLYPLVRKSIRVGAENYSLKSLEPLYMGSQLRSGDVTTASDSIVQYARYCELRGDGRGDEAAVLLKEISDYNHYDCISTRRLRDWLINRAIECGVLPLGTQPVAGGTGTEDDDRLARTLAAFAGDAVSGRTAEQTAVALIAAARGYHRREDKPFWWAHFDRLNNPVDEWGDSADVFVVDAAEVVRDWHLPSTRARKLQRWVKLTGTLASGGLAGSVFALYEPPAPAGLSVNPDRRAAGNAEIIDVDDPSVPTEVTICEREPTPGGPFTQLPFALTPGRPFATGKLRESIDNAAAEVAAALPALSDTAIVDVLLRRPPRTRSGAPLPHTGDPAADITAALRDLNSSYLAVHGPPGTGKTSTAAKIIARLVNDDHWRVGVAAQSHAVVENLFRDLIRVGVDPARIAKKESPDGVPWQVVDKDRYAAFIASGSDERLARRASGSDERLARRALGTGCVIGGTAWDFANDTRVAAGSLDLLVIEEAGQFCLANTIAVARAATNLMFLGDPQQLPQVRQGRHPEPVDASALGWLVEDHRTLPEQRGYFLDLSYRMHPAVCLPVSRLSYDDRLRSDERLTAVRRLDGHAPGVRTLLVEHNGNATSSPEEAAAIVAEIRRLLHATWTDEHGSARLRPADVLVVAPYNAQVLVLRDHLDAAGLRDVDVGTVDKFQGRQAPVVFVSMTASSIDDVPRGISFLLNRNRLNVAVSRAKFASVIVRSPMLTEYLPSTPAGLVDLGAFLALSQPDRRR